MFITIEDETGIANLVVWPKRVRDSSAASILAAGMMAVHGRIQREGEVVHLVAQRLHDLSGIWPASASATPPSRCRTAAATSSITAARAMIRATCHPAG